MTKNKYIITNSQVGAIGENVQGTLNIENNMPMNKIDSVACLKQALNKLRKDLRQNDIIVPEVLVALKFLEEHAEDPVAPTELDLHWQNIKAAGDKICTELYNIAISTSGSLASSWIVESIKILCGS